MKSATLAETVSAGNYYKELPERADIKTRIIGGQVKEKLWEAIYFQRH